MVKRLTEAARRRIDALIMSFFSGYLGALGVSAAGVTALLVHWLVTHIQ